YNYAQNLTDMTALIARTGAESVDWVGTSMGGLIGMLLAAEANTPIRRTVINDAGPFIPLNALKRIGAYVGQSLVFDGLEGVEKHMREIYAPFGDLSEDNWRHLARYGARTLPNNKLSLAWDPGIAQPILTIDQDVDLWPAYDRIRCPVLLLHGLDSDILPTQIAQEMTQRGPRAQLVELPKIGQRAAAHGPDADCDRCRVLAAVTGGSAHMPFAEQHVHPATRARWASSQKLAAATLVSRVSITAERLSGSVLLPISPSPPRMLWVF
ncbi:MAG TPA: alpha/beta hydrolase, partial [Pyrinomonadaceae bacterium]|nr:alpha/beta hydrolase [Pyrinomonadaceae bacterium]